MKSRETFLFLAVAILFVFGNSVWAYLPVIDLWGGTDSWANSINNNGQIVGGVYISSLDHACLFDPTGHGANIDLGGLWANSINDNGQIVGCVGSHAGLFDPTGGGANKDLGTLRSYPYSEARSINNNGQIVGYVWNNYLHTDERACLFDPTGGGANKDLGALGTLDASHARSINNKGQIVGVAYHSTGGGDHACLFDPTGGGANIDLGEGEAYCINDIGQIVGISTGGATLFDPTGHGNNTNLNTLIDPSSGWILDSACSINNNGWIVGWGYKPVGGNYGPDHAFLLTPEPTTVLLLGLGMVIIRRKK